MSVILRISPFQYVLVMKSQSGFSLPTNSLLAVPAQRMKPNYQERKALVQDVI